MNVIIISYNLHYDCYHHSFQVALWMLWLFHTTNIVTIIIIVYHWHCECIVNAAITSYDVRCDCYYPFIRVALSMLLLFHTTYYDWYGHCIPVTLWTRWIVLSFLWFILWLLWSLQLLYEWDQIIVVAFNVSTSKFLMFLKQMFIISAGINKMLASIAIRKDPAQTVSAGSVWYGSALFT